MVMIKITWSMITCRLILDMLDKLEDNQEVDIKKLNKLVDEVQKLGRINPNFRPEDIKEIREIISSKTKNIDTFRFISLLGL